MTQTVLLRHVLPDGSSHHDWLIARAEPPGAPDDRALIAFRLGVLPWERDVRRFTATRLPDHRVAYLTHEGPISGDRGSVTRLRSGQATLMEGGGAGEPMLVEIDFGDGPRRLRGRPGEPPEADRWVFHDAG